MNKLHFFSIGISGLFILGNVFQTSHYSQSDYGLTATNEKYEQAIAKVYSLDVSQMDKKNINYNHLNEAIKGTAKKNTNVSHHVWGLNFNFSYPKSRDMEQGLNEMWFKANSLYFNRAYSKRNIRWNITTFELPLYFKIEDFPIITFNNSYEFSNIPTEYTPLYHPYTKASWGSWEYSGRDVKQAFDKKNILEIGTNYPATNYEDMMKYTNTYLLRKTDKYGPASVNLKIDVGINYFTFKNRGYLQFLTYLYGETWTSASGGGLWINWGGSFGLWKKKIVKYIGD